MRWEVTVHWVRKGCIYKKWLTAKYRLGRKMLSLRLQSIYRCNNGRIYFFGRPFYLFFIFLRTAGKMNLVLFLWSIQSKVVSGFSLQFSLISSAFISSILVHCQSHKHVLNTGSAEGKGSVPPKGEESAY